MFCPKFLLSKCYSIKSHFFYVNKNVFCFNCRSNLTGKRKKVGRSKNDIGNEWVISNCIWIGFMNFTKSAQLGGEFSSLLNSQMSTCCSSYQKRFSYWSQISIDVHLRCEILNSFGVLVQLCEHIPPMCNNL